MLLTTSQSASVVALQAQVAAAVAVTLQLASLWPTLRPVLSSATGQAAAVIVDVAARVVVVAVVVVDEVAVPP